MTCNKKTMKSINVRALLSSILKNGPISQKQLFESSSLDKCTISVLINELKGQGFLNVTGSGDASVLGGRKPQFMELEKEKITALGIVLRDKKLSFALHNLKGKLLWKNEVSLKEVVSSEWAPAILQNIGMVESECAKNGFIFLGTGYAVGCYYNPAKNTLVRVTDSSENNIDLNELIENKLTNSTFTADDFPNAMAIGEMWFGNTRGVDNFLYVQLHPVRITLVAGGEIYRGFRGFAGEVGSSNAVKKMVDFTESSDGVMSEKHFKEWIYDLALSFDPEKIVISPENKGTSDSVILQNINSYLKKQYVTRAVSDGIENVVTEGKLGKNERSLGAAALAFQKYFYPDFIGRNYYRIK